MSAPMQIVPRASAPPGGPFSPDFHDAIHELAQQARDEDLRAAADLRKRTSHRPIQKFIRLGMVLIALQAVVFVYLYSQSNRRIVAPVVTRSLFPKNNCSAVLYRTYWKVVAYFREQGHPPANLSDLVLEQPPFDPITGKPLVYRTDGERFTLQCPGVKSAGSR